MKTCPICKADIQTGFRDDDGCWHKAKIWGNPLKPIVQAILEEVEGKEMFDIKEYHTWSGDAHLTVTLTVNEVTQLARFAGLIK